MREKVNEIVEKESGERNQSKKMLRRSGQRAERESRVRKWRGKGK